jgi:hypothetical protein
LFDESDIELFLFFGDERRSLRRMHPSSGAVRSRLRAMDKKLNVGRRALPASNFGHAATKSPCPKGTLIER